MRPWRSPFGRCRALAAAVLATAALQPATLPADDAVGGRVGSGVIGVSAPGTDAGLDLRGTRACPGPFLAIDTATPDAVEVILWDEYRPKPPPKPKPPLPEK